MEIKQVPYGINDPREEDSLEDGLYALSIEPQLQSLSLDEEASEPCIAKKTKCQYEYHSCSEEQGLARVINEVNPRGIKINSQTNSKTDWKQILLYQDRTHQLQVPPTLALSTEKGMSIYDGILTSPTYLSPEETKELFHYLQGGKLTEILTGADSLGSARDTLLEFLTYSRLTEIYKQDISFNEFTENPLLAIPKEERMDQSFCDFMKDVKISGYFMLPLRDREKISFEDFNVEQYDSFLDIDEKTKHGASFNDFVNYSQYVDEGNEEFSSLAAFMDNETKLNALKKVGKLDFQQLSKK